MAVVRAAAAARLVDEGCERTCWIAPRR